MSYAKMESSDKNDVEKRLAAFRARCRQLGLKVTPQRMAVYKVLVQSKNHPSAEMTYRRVREIFPNISLDTVNRTLITITEMALAFTVEGTGDARRYDGDMEDHQHFKCLKCRRIVDIFKEPFADIHVPEELEKFLILRKTVYFEGLCAKCRQES